MKILLDANIVITHISNREDKYQEDIDNIIRLCMDEKIECYMAFHTLSIVWYTMRRIPKEILRESLDDFCIIVGIASADIKKIRTAIVNRDFPDFEDNLQDCCAQTVGADYIVTANVRDYEGHSVVKAVTPSELLDILNNSDTDSQWEVREPQVEYNPQGAIAPFQAHFHILFSRHAA